MASAPEGTDPPELKTVALKVSIHCEGCKKKVMKVLWRVEGVGRIDVDSKQNKVTVTGSANAESLIRKLVKYGKLAELWPDTKPSASNSSSAAEKSSGEYKEKDKAAPSAAATATPPETEQQQQPTTEKKQQTEDAKTAPPPPTETTKTSPTLPATAASSEVSASKHNIDAPESNASETPANPEKPAAAADSENIKKNGKQVEITGDESAVSHSDEQAARTATAAAMNPPAPRPFPAYPLSAYTASYSTVRPSVSYSYYLPSPAMPSSHTTYSDHPPAAPSSYATYSNYPPLSPAMPSSYTTYSSYAPVPAYSTDSYYGSMEAPAASEGSYDMFNDENPNACNLM